MSTARDLRKQLVDVALEWEKHFGVAPSITSAISELGAARLVGMSEDAYCAGEAHIAPPSRRILILSAAKSVTKLLPADLVERRSLRSDSSAIRQRKSGLSVGIWLIWILQNPRGTGIYSG